MSSEFIEKFNNDSDMDARISTPYGTYEYYDSRNEVNIVHRYVVGFSHNCEIEGCPAYQQYCREIEDV